jgi:hypothetical protein
MAGDGQKDVTKKIGADDPAKTVLHINLVDLSGDGKAKPASTATSTELPIQLADATLQMNGRHSGPTSSDGNPYTSAGGGVAPGFQVNGKRPQDSIPAAGTTGAPDWNDPAAVAKRNADMQALIAQQQANNQAGENQVNPKAAAQPGNGRVVDPGHDLDGNPIHTLGPWGGAYAALMAVPYTKYVHPLVQRVGIPAQLKVDAKAEAGELTPLGKAADYIPKAYLKAFSPTYVAQTELKRILPIETTAKTHLAQLKTEAQEHVDALNLTKAGRADLKKVAEGSPTTPEAIAEKARAERQMEFLARADKSGLRKATLLAQEKDKIDFLKTNDKFVAGGKVAESEASSLNWSGLVKKMEESKVFSGEEMKPVAEIASKEQPFASVGGKMLSRGELEAIQTATAEGKGFFGTIGSGLKRFGVPLAIVGTASYAQIQAARSLGNNDGTTFLDNIKNRAARIIEPTVPGVVAKDLALMLSSNVKTKAITYLGAQAYESESNMTHAERLGTMIVGLAPAAGALLLKNKEVAVGLAVADAAIGAAAEVTNDLWFNNDKSLSAGAKAIKTLSANPKDLSHSTLNSSVSDFTAIGKDNPFLLTAIYDQAHKPQLTENSSVLERQQVYKQQLVISQAQGENILSNGLTKSQYEKMGNRDAALTDTKNHVEEWRIAPTRGIDIGSMGAKALIGAVGSANLAEWAASQTGTDTSGVEKQKQGIKDQLKDLFTAPHQGQIENALKGSEWGWNLFGKANQDYNLVEFWKHDAFDYAHITDLIGRTADYNASQLGGMANNLNAAQASLDALKAPNSNASPTAIAAAQHMVDARNDALGLTTGYTAKLYRDKALMKMGEAQYMLENAHSGNTQEGGDIKAELDDAMTALNNSAKYAPGNADAKILASMTVTMYQSANLQPTYNFQPNP